MLKNQNHHLFSKAFLITSKDMARPEAIESTGILAFGAAATLQYLFIMQMPTVSLRRMIKDLSATSAVCSWITLIILGSGLASMEAEAEAARKMMRAIMVSSSDKSSSNTDLPIGDQVQILTLANRYG